jgi:hypothetical protein
MDATHSEQIRDFRVALADSNLTEIQMNGIIYLVGLVVVVLAILSFLGLN